MSKYLFLVFACSAAMSIAVPMEAHAKRAKNYIGCVSKSALDQYNSALSRGDNRLTSSMLGSECMLVSGMEYSILSRGFAVSQAKFYDGSASINLWVPSEAIE